MVTCAILACKNTQHAARIAGNSKVMHARIAHVIIALLRTARAPFEVEKREIATESEGISLVTELSIIGMACHRMW